MPPSARKVALQVAGNLGMDSDSREALSRLLALAENRKTAVAGCFMPDSGVSALLAEKGITENVDAADFFRFRRVATPYGGISPRQRRDWEEAGHSLEDLTSPQVRRALVALGLLRMEGAQGLVIGRHEDPESLALAGGSPGTKIIEDTTDTSRLLFSPTFGVVCQTTLSPKKVAWLVQQLRFRYRDARVTFLDTVSPAMAMREEALEKLLVTCDRAVIVGRPGEASCEALMETALRRGKPAVVVTGPDDVKPEDFAGNPRVALTAGAFALDETIRAVAEALARM
jgi:4-hydroxy-3-methylbut-2-enyl diphosphate reductase IspH